MINVLPPQTKQEVNYAKQNSKLLRFIGLTLLVEILLGTLLAAGFLYADKQTEEYQANLASRQQQRSSFEAVKKDVERLRSTLSTIDSLLNEKTQYSALLRDLAAALPDNTYIMQTQLTGDDTKPMEIQVSTDSIDRAAQVRNGLIQSERIKSADIQSVTGDEDSGRYTAILVVAFEKGGAR